MKTKDAIRLAGSAAALSRILNITQSAVCQWKEDVPELSLFRLRTLKPNWFKAQSRKSRSSAEPAIEAVGAKEASQAPATSAQAATEPVAAEPVDIVPAGALRTGAVRRSQVRRAKDLPLDVDRRAKSGPPFQSLETGVA